MIIPPLAYFGSGIATSVVGSSLYLRVLQKFDKDNNTNNNDHNNDNDDNNKHNLSSRGIEASQSEPLSYFKSYLKAMANPCHEKTNKDGYISLCLAENKLILPELSKRLIHGKNYSYSSVKSRSESNKSFLSTAQIAFGNETNFCYNNNNGIEEVRQQVANFITRKFIKLDNTNTHDDTKSNTEFRIDTTHGAKADQIVLGAGAAAILNFLFRFIAEEKEVVLIPAPYYAAFEYDMSIIAKCVPYPVHMDDPSNGPKVDELEKVYQTLQKQGLKVRTLLLTNPNNPLGTIYSPTVIKNCITWARSKHMHTIVDEIYALSVHDKDNHKFQSVTQILQNNLGNDVHFIWALSKDFGSSGFRVGILYTHNQSILAAFGSINMFSNVSHPIQAIVGDLLSDDQYVDYFLDTARTLLRTSYEIVTQAMDGMDIPYVHAEAGIFVYCDFSSLLRDYSFDSEDELGRVFEEYGRVVLTPGRSQRDDKVGRFRVCYAFVSPEVLRIGMRRIGRICKLIRESGSWDVALKTLKEKEVVILKD